MVRRPAGRPSPLVEFEFALPRAAFTMASTAPPSMSTGRDNSFDSCGRDEGAHDQGPGEYAVLRLGLVEGVAVRAIARRLKITEEPSPGSLGAIASAGEAGGQGFREQNFERPRCPPARDALGTPVSEEYRRGSDVTKR